MVQVLEQHTDPLHYYHSVIMKSRVSEPNNVLHVNIYARMRAA